ncbi:hypothetical protein C8Q72DRAFT_501707 [Fomitopsis betulina]|nr:hypothetical protein C8Q72DRAFT_501707 [Fomitopsis betulina]
MHQSVPCAMLTTHVAAILGWLHSWCATNSDFARIRHRVRLRTRRSQDTGSLAPKCHKNLMCLCSAWKYDLTTFEVA